VPAKAGDLADAHGAITDRRRNVRGVDIGQVDLNGREGTAASASRMA